MRPVISSMSPGSPWVCRARPSVHRSSRFTTRPCGPRGAVCITISQSGKSPDIVALQNAAKRAGAVTVALVNEGNTPRPPRTRIFACRCMRGRN